MSFLQAGCKWLSVKTVIVIVIARKIFTVTIMMETYVHVTTVNVKRVKIKQKTKLMSSTMNYYFTGILIIFAFIYLPH